MLLLSLLVACQEYDLNKRTDGDGPADTGEDGGGGYFDSGEYPYEDTDPRRCEDRSLPAQDIAQNDECFSEGPTVGSFTPIVEWTKTSWSTNPSSINVMMMPAVGSLTDDDGDGDADADDVPDIVIVTYDNGQAYGTLRAVSGDGGAEIFNVTNANLSARIYGIPPASGAAGMIGTAGGTTAQRGP